jgi:acyl dehydratase
VPLDLTLIGEQSESAERSRDSADAILYALGVGAGLGDPLRELEFTTENSAGVEQKVLPTFAVLVARAGGRRRLGDVDPALLVHAEQAITLHRPLPVAGTSRTTARVTGIYDKGSGALVATESVAVDARTGEPLVTSVASAFIRGEGGFGGDRGRPIPGSGPTGSRTTVSCTRRGRSRPCSTVSRATATRSTPTRGSPPGAASTGRSCTASARTASPGRALLHALYGSDPARFGSMRARFSRPVLAGDALVVSIWADAGGALFQTAKEDGTVVIDRGRFTLAAED